MIIDKPAGGRHNCSTCHKEVALSSYLITIPESVAEKALEALSALQPEWLDCRKIELGSGETSPLDIPIDRVLSKRVCRVLKISRGTETLGELLGYSRQEHLRDTYNLGAVGLDEIDRTLARYGLKLRG